MLNFGKTGTAIALAALMTVVGCGKKSTLSKNTPPPSVANRTSPPVPSKPSPTNPTFNAQPTFLEGNWATNCQADYSIGRVIIKGNSMQYSHEQFSDSDCTGPGQVIAQFDSLFTLATIQDAVYSNEINYLSDDGSVWFSENVVKTSNGLSFSSDEYVYIKQ